MTSDVIRPTLGIGIPTYNRPEALCRRINEISSNSMHIDEVVICDNSDVTDELINTALHDCPIVRYEKNNSNIGGGANFIRVLERSSTDYLWWRGDDDVISFNQISAVRAHITTTPRLILLSPFIAEEFKGIGINSFIENFNIVNTMGWLSSVVLPAKIAKKSICWGYSGIASGWAHVMLILGIFRANPELQFCVVPIKLDIKEFRDTGRDAGMSWAFFETCVKNFPLVANSLESKKLKHRFLKNWRLTQGFYLLNKMFRMRLGYMRQENITIPSILPLIAVDSPKSSLIGICLYLMSKTPRIVFQVIFAMVWPLLPERKKESLGLDFLLSCRTYVEVYQTLSKVRPETNSNGAFL